jgi:hypothetical protein
LAYTSTEHVVRPITSSMKLLFGITVSPSMAKNAWGNNLNHRLAASDSDEYGEGYVTTDTIAIASYSDLELSIYLAGDASHVNYENESIYLEYSIDGGGWTSLMRFCGNIPGGSGDLYEDTDMNGVGDSLQVTPQFSPFTMPYLPLFLHSLHLIIHMACQRFFFWARPSQPPHRKFHRCNRTVSSKEFVRDSLRRDTKNNTLKEVTVGHGNNSLHALLLFTISEILWKHQ